MQTRQVAVLLLLSVVPSACAVVYDWDDYSDAPSAVPDAGGPEGGGGGGGADGPDASPVCGPTTVAGVHDDFEDPLVDRMWVVATEGGDGSITETGGQLVVTLAKHVAQYHYYSSAVAYSLRGCALFVKVAEVPPLDYVQYAFFGLQSGTQYLEFYTYNGDVVAFANIAGVETYAPTPWMPEQHRFWRIREQGGEVYFGLSADGSRYDEVFQITTPEFADAVTIILGAATYGVAVDPGVARFDGVNVK